MLDRRVKLFTLLGFPVYLDMSWFVLAILIIWSLSVGYFPNMVPGYSTAVYISMGLLGALGLFLSIVIHEFCHSITARAFNMPMGGITLFLFGGVAEMTQEPTSPKSELLIALAGPFSSLLLVILLNILAHLGLAFNLPEIAIAVLRYLALINGILIVFNLVPAFPLDGGRVMRAILWQMRKDMLWATRVTATIGKVFGISLIVVGVISAFAGQFIGGMWWVLIGYFLQNAAAISYEQTAMNQKLSGQTVGQHMQVNPVAIPSTITLSEWVTGYYNETHQQSYPVVDHDRPVGIIGIDRLKTVPKDKWNRMTVAQAMEPISDDLTVTPADDAVKAFNMMNRQRSPHLMVMEEGHLTGIITMNALMSYLTLHLDLPTLQKRLRPST